MPLYRFESLVDLIDDDAAYAMSAELQELAFEYVTRGEEMQPNFASVVVSGYVPVVMNPEAPQPVDRKGAKLAKQAKKRFRKGGK